MKLSLLAESGFKISASMMQFVNTAVTRTQNILSFQEKLTTYEDDNLIFSMPVITDYGTKRVDFHFFPLDDQEYHAQGINFRDHGEVHLSIGYANQNAKGQERKRPLFGTASLQKTILHELIHCFDPGMYHPGQGANAKFNRPTAAYHNLPIEINAELSATAFTIIKQLRKQYSTARIQQLISNTNFVANLAKRMTNLNKLAGMPRRGHHFDTYKNDPKVIRGFQKILYKYLTETN